MNKIFILFLSLAILPGFSIAQNSHFIGAYKELELMLSEKQPLSFKKAVFSTENAFFEGNLSFEEFSIEIDWLKRLTLRVSETNELKYGGKDVSQIKINAALFFILTDSVTIVIDDDTLTHIPYKYDFDDIFGTKNWAQTFITKLLHFHKGNCHSLPYLYKIIANEIGIKAYLALAPNHIYIKHRAEKGGWYNTELTSASFPIDAWLMASGYITLEAIQNGIYMDTLSEKESIALCVVDLAQGYDHKYPGNDGKFVIECCDLALQHFPDCINAMMLKAETQLRQLQQMQKAMKFAYLKEVTRLPEGKNMWDEMNALYGRMLDLGYRQMPEQMYVDWLVSLKNEKEKYTNKQAPGATKNE